MIRYITPTHSFHTHLDNSREVQSEVEVTIDVERLGLTLHGGMDRIQGKLQGLLAVAAVHRRGLGGGGGRTDIWHYSISYAKANQQSKGSGKGQIYDTTIISYAKANQCSELWYAKQSRYAKLSYAKQSLRVMQRPITQSYVKANAKQSFWIIIPVDGWSGRDLESMRRRWPLLTETLHGFSYIQ